MLGRPDRLHQAPGDRPTAGLLQAGLHNQLQRRLGLGPLAFQGQRLLAIGVEYAFVQFEILAQLFFSDGTELVARQGFDRLTQWPHVHLATDAVTGGGRAVEVTTVDLDDRVIRRAQRRVTALEFQRQAFGQEVFDEKFIQLRLAVTEVEYQLPATGRSLAGQLQRVLIQAGRVGLPHELAAHLFIRAPYFDADRLRLYRLAILVTQQRVEQHGFAGAIQITRAEHKELQRVGRLPADIELRQIQRGAVQAQQAGLLALLGQ